MVLGNKYKHKKGVAIRVDYMVHVESIKPWPPSESLTSVQTVLLQWENTSGNSGSFLSVAGESNIVFNESFVLPTTLYKKQSGKVRKNYLEFSLVEPRQDKAKGINVLGKASLNLADYGLTQQDVIAVNAPISFKKSYSNAVQPCLGVTLEVVERDHSSNSSPSVSLSQELGSMDNEDDDDEKSCFTDDDAASSHSSRTIGSSSMASPSQTDKVGSKASSLFHVSDSSSDTWNKVKDYVSSSKFSERSMSYAVKNSDSASPLITSSPTSISFREMVSHGGSKARLKHMKSIQMHNSGKANGFSVDSSIGGKPPDLDIPNGSQRKPKLSPLTERKAAKTDDVCDGKNELRLRVEVVEEELREVAAMEVALYSIVAEHSSSKSKVHAPARRLCRFYKSACRTGSQAKRARAAKAAVSGLLVVSRACGNDVPRLSFWLSNSIMTRSIITEIAAELPNSKSNGASSESDDLEDVLTLLIALERLESWLFSRIIEYVWWQCFTPHMQPKGSSRERSKGSTRKRNGLSSYEEQGSFCIELWKKAFKDAGERVCPIRGGGVECGCLSAQVTLVMENLVSRLDVAMFNAILRQSSQEMPTDPVSDPITDSRVLPVPPAKTSFTAGAQLKNIIGNWSRWLSDLFGLGEEDDKGAKCFKPFGLLHALSDLMMLPSGMLLHPSTRKEVCPLFGPTIIKRVLDNFVPDEFCPNPIPRYIMDALSLEVDRCRDLSGDVVNKFPWNAKATKYSAPPAALLKCIGEVGNQVLKSSRLSTLRKSHASDDELDVVNSALTRIVPDDSSALTTLSLMPNRKGAATAHLLRFQLLRETWNDVEY